MIREDLRKYIGEAMDNWCDDNNITENREERFKKEFLETVDDSWDIFYSYIEPTIALRDKDITNISNTASIYLLCKEIVKGE